MKITTIKQYPFWSKEETGSINSAHTRGRRRRGRDTTRWAFSNTQPRGGRRDIGRKAMQYGVGEQGA